MAAEGVEWVFFGGYQEGEWVEAVGAYDGFGGGGLPERGVGE